MDGEPPPARGLVKHDRMLADSSGVRATLRTAILLFAHEFGQVTIDAYRRLDEQTAGFGDLFVLNDGVQPAPLWMGDRLHVFDFEAIKREVPGVLGDSVVPGNCHLATLDFHRNHPEYDFLWVIEYDVRFSGSWAAFLRAHQGNRADLLACHIRAFRDEPAWFWWHSLAGPQGVPSEDRRFRAFLPIQRLSGAALVEIDRQVSRGWVGHFECLVPTLIAQAGMQLEDIGGRGPFVREGNEGRFYSSLSTREGGLKGLGSMRHQPPIAYLGLRRNRLFHPVKKIGVTPGSLIISSWWRAKYGARALARRAAAWLHGPPP
jgi:hypothetical protein